MVTWFLWEHVSRTIILFGLTSYRLSSMLSSFSSKKIEFFSCTRLQTLFNRSIAPCFEVSMYILKDMSVSCRGITCSGGYLCEGLSWWNCYVDLKLEYSLTDSWLNMIMLRRIGWRCYQDWIVFSLMRRKRIFNSFNNEASTFCWMEERMTLDVTMVDEFEEGFVGNEV